MDDKKDSQNNDKQKKARNANATRSSWEDRIRCDVEQLLEAYNGNYSEVLEAYRQSEQAANRRAKRLEKQAIQAKHEWQIANYELCLAKDLIDDMQRRRTR